MTAGAARSPLLTLGGLETGVGLLVLVLTLASPGTASWPALLVGALLVLCGHVLLAGAAVAGRDSSRAATDDDAVERVRR